MGLIDDIARTVPIETEISMNFRSIMGVELPMVTLAERPLRNHAGYPRTNSLLDQALAKFDEVKKRTVKLCEIENSVYRLAQGIKKTQKRANALKNIVIPRFETSIKYISDVLEEKEREEFSRLKVIKRSKG